MLLIFFEYVSMESFVQMNFPGRGSNLHVLLISKSEGVFTNNAQLIGQWLENIENFGISKYPTDFSRSWEVSV